MELDSDLLFRLDHDNRSGAFVDTTGRSLLSYGELVAWDATGRTLDAWIVSNQARLEVWVQDSGAVYPIMIDPLMTQPSWSAESNQANAWFGHSVSSAGDVNGDGYDDVVVGARLYDNGQGNEGRAYVYHGGSFGLEATPSWTAESNVTVSFFGTSVATAGDVNGDGYSDVIVGAPSYTNGVFREGRAFVYHGSAGGLELIQSWAFDSQEGNSGFGSSVASAGDVNGDGYSDVIVGAPGYSNGEINEGRAYLFLGSSSGLLTTASWTIESNQPSELFGGSVACAGDVNGDGYSDVIVGATGYISGTSPVGRAYVYHGSPSGLSNTAAWTAESDQDNSLFGISVSTAGDVNGDGFADVIVGASALLFASSPEGRAYVFHGSPTGLSETEAWIGRSDQDRALYGVSVSSAEDVDGDGYSDVIVGASYYGISGRAYAYHGTPVGLSTVEGWTADLRGNFALFGDSVSNAGDVNGDGFGDAIVGAVFYSNGETSEGGAFVYHGSPPPSADGAVYNGSGVNLLCLTSEPPVVGEAWDSTIDTSVRAAASSSLLVAFALEGSGVFLSGGEVLVALNSTPYFVLDSAASGSSTTYSQIIALDSGLAGLGGTIQGVVFGSGYTLCNAYTFTIGY